ncbi:hypothetical protein LJ707_07270 [Mucilaginibacter sp. UR6-1]|uniref:hypothetical protein n=1 Tax=Mucilaginibacter sp. UR6-1 TaxID=1435643 RepID=UPI001E44A787|nr:hypothetical protein [Mucilaginibacter sp. UR6-1]MCC8408723.1 hypothetical protein [Mucilaginibacter sp. UR6-1]
MLKPHMPAAVKYVITGLLMLASNVNYGFDPDASELKMLGWSNRCLTQNYDAGATGKLKKWELTLTANAFIRMRRTYQTGKQEYFSFQLQRLDDMDYIGTVNNGTIKLRTTDADVIVQTYNDRKGGDVDSMASVLSIPVKNMEPEMLDSLRNVLLYFKKRNM